MQSSTGGYLVEAATTLDPARGGATPAAAFEPHPLTDQHGRLLRSRQQQSRTASRSGSRQNFRDIAPLSWQDEEATLSQAQRHEHEEHARHRMADFSKIIGGFENYNDAPTGPKMASLLPALTS